ncbi:hypothetical protein GCM10010872_06400 [Dyella flava]|nr:hypothetical protein GCM10010872_06400 [Dyella flava]
MLEGVNRVCRRMACREEGSASAHFAQKSPLLLKTHGERYGKLSAVPDAPQRRASIDWRVIKQGKVMDR